ncbi:Uncharacterised protein [Mycobacteroides abscessus subsp. abscessus]|nr:Uncharacterised protein [Mycobacteroides abscessus subsp. abscessus]
MNTAGASTPAAARVSGPAGRVNPHQAAPAITPSSSRNITSRTASVAARRMVTSRSV